MILVHTTVVKLLDRDLVESHWWLDDLHFVTFPRDQLRNEQHIGEEEAVNVHLAGKDQATVSVENMSVCVCVHACSQVICVLVCVRVVCCIHIHFYTK